MAEHTYSRRPRQECALCPGRGGKPGPCDHHRYPMKMVGFTEKHLEELESGGWTERHQREYDALPPRHFCTCRCPWEREGCPTWGTSRHNSRSHPCQGPPSPPCMECRDLRDRDKPCPTHGLGRIHWDCPDCTKQDVAVEIGRTEMVHPPIPVDPVLLDLARAAKAGARTLAERVRRMNGDAA